ncbi:unnamed protein product [Owenia fusiformis]|uniref:Uncharacterized protein n=1 Tax=Owenia fusiformis TaxID=6347 RepID=A0A8J1URP9_OWEFU|nr:unnamed protein product [Owenia fusiformis]
MSDFKVFMSNKEVVKRIQTIGSHYRKHVPSKLKKATGSKSKLATLDSLNEHCSSDTYCVFRTNQDGLLNWIITLHLYYEDYNNKQMEICEDLKKISVEASEYKVTVFLTTGTIQIQGNNITEFKSQVFPILKSTTYQIKQSNTEKKDNTQDQSNTQIKSITSTTDINDHEIKSTENDTINNDYHDNEVTNVKLRCTQPDHENAQDENEIEDLEDNNVHENNIMNHNNHDNENPAVNNETPTVNNETPIVNNETPTVKNNETPIVNNETLTVKNKDGDKKTKVTSTDNVSETESNNTKSCETSILQQELSKITRKMEKLENTVCDLIDKVSVNNVSQKETRCSGEESTCEHDTELRRVRKIRKEQADFVTDQARKIKAYQSEIDHQQTIISSKNREIEELNEKIQSKMQVISKQDDELHDLNTLRKKVEKQDSVIRSNNNEMEELQQRIKNKNQYLEDKEEENFELKLQCKKLAHEKKDDTPYTVVTRKSNNLIEITNDENSEKEPTVKLIGSSILSHVDGKRMSGLNVSVEQAYTIQQAKDYVNGSTSKPDITVFQVLSNDVKSVQSDERIIKSMEELVKLNETKAPNSKIIVSLPPPRKDNPKWNLRQKSIASQLEVVFHDNDNVTCCPNDNLGLNGQPKPHLYRDNVHINEQGTRVLCGNILRTVRKFCNLSQPAHRNNNNMTSNNNFYGSRPRYRQQYQRY